MTEDALKQTPLHAAHVDLGARMVPFGGYDMPVQYPEGIMAEHRWTREHAGLFDVSHMGPAFLTLSAPEADAAAGHAAVCALIERLIPGDIQDLAPGKYRYTVLLNEAGGILDDLVVGRGRDDAALGSLPMVVNAGTKDADFALMAKAAGAAGAVRRVDHDALLALQGPEAAAVFAEIVPESARLVFMEHAEGSFEGHPIAYSRSGYTGEDGFEIRVPAAAARAFWDRLLSDPRVKAIGLGARDSLRLEAGLPLYGHDLDGTTSPIEAGIAFVVNKRRREAADFPGAERILREIKDGPARKRVGLLVTGAPAREGAEIADADGKVVGVVTSGGFAPTLSRPIAMGYVPPALSAPGTPLQVLVRGRAQAAEVTAMPFVPHRYVRQA